jgi:hypothetical protein
MIQEMKFQYQDKNNNEAVAAANNKDLARVFSSSHNRPYGDYVVKKE